MTDGLGAGVQSSRGAVTARVPVAVAAFFAAGLSLALAIGFWWWLTAPSPAWFESLFGVLHWGDLTAPLAVVLGVASALVLRHLRRRSDPHHSRLLLAGSLLGWAGAAAMAAAYLTPLVLLFLSAPRG